VKAAFFETGKKVAPVNLGLAQGDAGAEDGSSSILPNADGDEDGAGTNGSWRHEHSRTSVTR
jgi:hypothetical protein